MKITAGTIAATTLLTLMTWLVAPQPHNARAQEPPNGGLSPITTTSDANQRQTKQLERAGIQPYRIESPDTLLVCVSAAGRPKINSEFSVEADGCLHFASFDKVTIAGLTLEAAEESLPHHFSHYFQDVTVHVQLLACNSKVLRIVSGNTVTQLPCMGEQTVSETLAGLPDLRVAPEDKVWIVRPGEHEDESDQVLEVDWTAISEGTDMATNYCLMPEDILFLGENP